MFIKLFDSNHEFSQEELCKLINSNIATVFDNMTYILFDDNRYFCIYQYENCFDQPFELIKISDNDYYPLNKVRVS